MPTYTAANVDELVARLIDAQTATEPVTINLTSAEYDLSDYTDIDDIPSDDAFGVQTWAKSGLPHIKPNKEVTIQHSSSLSLSTITRTGTAYRHLYVEADGKLILRNLTLRNGDVGSLDSGGGAVSNDGVLQAYNCKFGPDNVSNYGGAILNFLGTVILDNCDLSGNQADWGGGLYNYLNCQADLTDCRVADNGAGKGGGLINFGTMNVTHCTINDNTASNGGGVANWANDSELTIERSFVNANSADLGGGAYAELGTIEVTCSTLVDNTANGGSVAYNNAGNISLATTSLPTDENGDTIDLEDGAYLVNVSVSSPRSYRHPAFTLPYNLATETLDPVYQYNRLAAAQYAIKESRNNFDSVFPYGGGNQTEDVVGTVGGPFIYDDDILTHQGIKTGSAIFMSESLYAGGFPQAYGLQDGQVDTSGCSNGTGSTTTGWRVCNGGLATQSWKDHTEVTHYFEAYDGIFKAPLSFDTIDDYVDFSDGAAVTDPEDLYDLFNLGGAYGDVGTGDYVYFDQGTCGRHGFLIVGWGPAVNVYDGVNARLDTEPDDGRTSFSLTRQVDTVPYVVDFCYGYNSSIDRTGWLQDPRPRPFYLSAATVDVADMDEFQQSHIGWYSISDYSDRLPGNFRPFLYSTVTGCPSGQYPAWSFLKVPNSIQLDYERILWAQC